MSAQRGATNAPPAARGGGAREAGGAGRARPHEEHGDAALAPELAAAFREHERALFLLCYRMTGSVADAQDLVQETFARALARPPADRSRPWKPWLVRVAVNLARDELRRRKRRPYTGPWLPAPLDTGAWSGELEAPEPAAASAPAGASLPVSYEPASTEQRYELLESVSLAFLAALEALRPTQRAVLLLQDVLDYSARETAEALGIGEANVRTTLHRARRAMAAYDAARRVPTPAQRERTRAAIGQLLAKLAARDAAGLEALLAEDGVLVSDGGGEFAAALVPIVGRRRVADLLVKLVRDAEVDVRIAELNGLPAVLLQYGETRDRFAHPRYAKRLSLSLDVDAEGRVRRIWSVLATRKLVGVFGEAGSPRA